MSILLVYLLAGALSGIAGLLVFLVVHHLWIAPIWSILPPGLVIAGLGGGAAGWAYSFLHPGLPARPWTWLILAGVFSACLLPAALIAALRAPLISPPITIIQPGEGGRVLAHIVLELLLSAALVGGAAGWLLDGGSWQAAGTTAQATLLFALGPGHNIPLLNGTSGMWKELALLLLVVLAASLALVEFQAVLSGD